MKRACFMVVLAGLAVTGRSADDVPSPTWSGEVAPILFRHCVECHHPGGPAPFSFRTYESAAKRARAIARLTQSRVMPPWLPSSPHGVFEGERRLTENEIATLVRWEQTGAPAGDLTTAPSAPPAPPSGWRLGPPDVVVRMSRPFAVPAGPGDLYQAFPIALPADAISAEVRESARIPGTDWLGVSAVEIRAGNRRLLHHAHLWADPDGEARRLEAVPGAGYAAFGNPGFPGAVYLGGYVPGTTARHLPAGIADVLPLGGDVVLQAHYSPTGKPETDRTEVGLYFTREPVKRTLEWLRLGSFNLEIPAGAADYTVTDELVVPADCFVLSVSPHLHFLGREVSARVLFPDGRSQELLTIARWDFRWQDRYSLKQPLALPAGARIQVRWVYDNSAANPHNPHTPPQPVHFGPNTTDEMCEFHLFVIPVELDDYPKFAALMAETMTAKIAELSPEQRQRYGFDAASKR